MEGWFEKDIFKEGSYFRILCDDGVCGSAPHWHEEIEIIYILEGSVKAGLNSRTYDLVQGDIFLIGSGDVHYFFPVKGRGKRIVIQFSLSMFDSVSGNVNESKNIKSLFAKAKKVSCEWDENSKADFNRLIKEIINEDKNKNEGYMFSIKAKIYDIIVLLMRCIPKEAEADFQNDKHKENLKRLEKTIDYVNDNYADSLSLKNASEAAGFSEYYFTRFFKKYTGISFHKYLSNFRISQAEWLLSNSDDSITQIAYKTGFASIKTFNKVFKYTKGCSPTEYKREQEMRSSEQ